MYCKIRFKLTPIHDGEGGYRLTIEDKFFDPSFSKVNNCRARQNIHNLCEYQKETKYSK